MKNKNRIDRTFKKYHHDLKFPQHKYNVVSTSFLHYIPCPFWQNLHIHDASILKFWHVHSLFFPLIVLQLQFQSFLQGRFRGTAGGGGALLNIEFGGGCSYYYYPTTFLCVKSSPSCSILELKCIILFTHFYY